MSNQANISVLQDFDGLNVNIIEVVSRRIQSTGSGSKTKYFVSYKGQKYDVFYLSPKSYNIQSANCISYKG